MSPGITSRAHGFLDSVLWTDTTRAGTFTSNPTAIVVMKGTDYAGHVYVWPEDDYVPETELHVIGLRKTLNIKVKIRLMPVIFECVEDYARKNGYSIIRVQDPIGVVPEFLESEGYRSTPRWHDLPLRDDQTVEESDYIKEI